MQSTREPADPVAKGVLATAKQSWRDLFTFKQRIVVDTDARGDPVATEWARPAPLCNPIHLLARLTPRAWLFFLVGFAAWTADAFDFHALAIQQVALAEYYDTSKTSLSTAITLTLLLRSLGAAAFGLAGDRFGRKWPMVANMLVLGLLQIATIYSSTLGQFLAVRSLFGLFMGGVYGNAIAMALENVPNEARGLVSGILQQGYSLGYICATGANLGVGSASGRPEGWKTVFWIAAGLSIGVGLVRCLFPESSQFIEARRARRARKRGASDSGSIAESISLSAAFLAETKAMLAREWRMCVYCVILMTWFNYYSHTSQDGYTTFLLVQKRLAPDAASRASIVMKTGACVGGMTLGYLSQPLGRRRTIIAAALLSTALIPLWVLPRSEPALSAGAFLLQFCVQGAWGVVPVHLTELAPRGFRASFPGLTYQLGNMLAAPAAQMVNAIAERHFVTVPVDGGGWERVEAYGPTMGVATAVIALGIMVTAAFGPERRGREFEKEGVVVGSAGLDGMGAGTGGGGVERDLERGDAVELSASSESTASKTGPPDDGGIGEEARAEEKRVNVRT